MFKKLAVGIQVVVLLLVLAVPALAYSTKSGNPGPFPDTCDIRGTNYYSGLYRSTTTEDANCARIEAELRYKDNGGIWRFRETGYVYASSVDTNFWTGQTGDYTDHNGDNNGSGTAYGFRLDTPGA